MRKPLDSRVAGDLAREVALRDAGIRALLTGRIDKLGSAYLMSVELVDPSASTAVASVSEEAVREGEVLAAVRRLSNQVRRLLGERLAEIRRTEEELAKVTTPSLRALKLYTQADLLLEASRRAEGAEELLGRAIAADPGFASAYTLLAWALWRRDDACLEDCMAHSGRAAELADTATDRERYFILGSYHQLRDQPEQAVANYRALLQIDPDHFWGLGNLATTLIVPLGRSEDAIPLVVHRARLRPNSFDLNAQAAVTVLRSSGSEEAEPHFARLAGLEPRVPTSAAAWVDAYWAHKAWLEGDLELVLSKIEHWARSLPTLTAEARSWVAHFAGNYCVYLGKLKMAEEIYRQRPDSVRREYYLMLVELDRGDQEHWRKVLERRSFPGSQSGGEVDLAYAGYHPWLAIRMVQAGLLEEARRTLSAIPRDRVPDVYNVAQGKLALAEGRTAEALSLLQETVAAMRRSTRNAPIFYYYGAEALAQAWEERGDLGNATRVLEDASAQKDKGVGGKMAWMAVQLRLARLYRKLGREADAREIEHELRRLLVYSDPDYWILLQLEKQSEDAAAASSP
jgi:tetratricopeptide (TPR) repeat protein